MLKYLSISAAVGVLATLLDWGLLVLLVKLGISERWAVVPAFISGAAVQFWGNRRWTFGQRGIGGHDAIARQSVRFIIVEAGTLALNFSAYNALREPSLLGIDFRAARVIAGFVVYICFSMPMWRWVFGVTPGAASPRDAQV